MTKCIVFKIIAIMEDGTKMKGIIQRVPFTEDDLRKLHHRYKNKITQQINERIKNYWNKDASKKINTLKCFKIIGMEEN